jgi:hypothetical protein
MSNPYRTPYRTAPSPSRFHRWLYIEAPAGTWEAASQGFAAVLIVALLVSGPFLACSAISPATGAILTSLNAAACSVLSGVAVELMPGVAPLVGAACSGEEAWVAGAIAHAELATSPSAAGGGGAEQPVAHRKVAAPGVLGARLYRMQGGSPVPIGHAPAGWDAGKVSRAQAWIYAGAAR